MKSVKWLGLQGLLGHDNCFFLGVMMMMVLVDEVASCSLNPIDEIVIFIIIIVIINKLS